MSSEQRAIDLVVKNEILKAQSVLEEKARKEWHRKWGFYLDFNKICLELAKEKGFTEEKYKRLTVMRKPKGNMEKPIWIPKPSNYVPNTTAGFVGWRANLDYSLEKFGKLYISPRYTLPYEPPYSTIFLG